jgi:hypothetical protein
MRHDTAGVTAVTGIDWKAIGYLISILSVFLLGAIAWPKSDEPPWHVPVLLAGMATSSRHGLSLQGASRPAART